jgi:hypothetical protein
MIQLPTKKNANRIFDFGFFPAVAGHADAWILDLIRAACKMSKSFVQRRESNQVQPNLGFQFLCHLSGLSVR